MTKAKPMTVSEFAAYAKNTPMDGKFDAMLSFVEDTVMERVCRIVCTDCDAISKPFLRDGWYWHHHPTGRDYPCRAERIRIEMAKDASSEGGKKL